MTLLFGHIGCRPGLPFLAIVQSLLPVYISDFWFSPVGCSRPPARSCLIVSVWAPLLSTLEGFYAMICPFLDGSPLLSHAS
ncbi:MAG: hypothetical protein ACFFCZ_18435 [Promethearchaeota archaeon]